jgi:LDH2 family malate/lactate/ureidoglycolate dehydrogenase
MRRTVESVFTALGMSEEHARQSADVLLFSDLHGYDTHGVSNMLRVYVELFVKGASTPRQIGRLRASAAPHAPSILTALTVG